jgi:hypothetical protein
MLWLKGSLPKFPGFALRFRSFKARANSEKVDNKIYRTRDDAKAQVFGCIQQSCRTN